MENQAKEEKVSEQVTDEKLSEGLTEEAVSGETNLADSVEADVASVLSEEEKEVETKTRKKKSKDDKDIVEEKTYTIPLGKALIMPPRKRAPRAIRMIKAYIVKHMKIPSRAEEEDEDAPKLMLTNELNERVWGRGIEKPPRKIRVRATKDKDGNVTVHLVKS